MKYVPENLVQTEYVPNVPDFWYRSGTQCCDAHLENNMEIIVFMKMLLGLKTKLLVLLQVYRILIFITRLNCNIFRKNNFPDHTHDNDTLDIEKLHNSFCT